MVAVVVVAMVVVTVVALPVAVVMFPLVVVVVVVMSGLLPKVNVLGRVLDRGRVVGDGGVHHLQVSARRFERNTGAGAVKELLARDIGAEDERRCDLLVGLELWGRPAQRPAVAGDGGEDKRPVREERKAHVGQALGAPPPGAHRRPRHLCRCRPGEKVKYVVWFGRAGVVL